MKKILIVEDDASALLAIKKYFQQNGFITATSSNEKHAILRGQLFNPDILITDWMLNANGNGVHVAKKLLDINCHLKIIIISAFSTSKLHEQCKGLSVTVLDKPVSLSTLHRIAEFGT
jgi:DNA-binding response OmpR family regulator